MILSDIGEYKSPKCEPLIQAPMVKGILAPVANAKGRPKGNTIIAAALRLPVE